MQQNCGNSQYNNPAGTFHVSQPVVRRNYCSYDPSSPASYGGKEAVHKAAKALYPKITRTKVATWLSKRFTYTMHKSVCYHTKTNRVFVEGIDHQWQADIADLGSVQKYNEGFQYLLTCTDIFTKYAWVVPLANKTGPSLVSAFKIILSTNRKPTFPQTDDGTKFINSVFQQLLKENGIKFFTTKSTVKRFNQILETTMWTFFTAENTLCYLDVLPELVSSYNSTYHRSIKLAPNEVSLLNVDLVRRNLYGNIKSKVKFKVSVEDRVLISKSRRTFRKRYLPNWTEEIFTISQRNYQKASYL